MKTTNIFILSFIALFLTACFTDKGNYEYNQVNRLLVTFPSGHVALMGETIVLSPTIKYPAAAEDGAKPLPKVTYEWIIDNEVVSTDSTFTYSAGNKIKSISGILKVQNIKTQEQYAGRFTISVESAYKVGYMILHEKENGAGELSFIRAVGTKTASNKDSTIYRGEYVNIYEQANGFSMPNNPVSITEHSLSNYSWQYPNLPTEITLITENGNFMEDLNGESFARETKIADEFANGELPDNFRLKEVVHTAWDSYLLDKNGTMYTRRSGSPYAFHTGIYSKDFDFNNGVKYSDVLFAFYSGSNSILAVEYDSQGKRNYVGIYSELYSNRYNGNVLPISAKSGVELSHVKDVKGQIITSDYNLYELQPDRLSHSVLMKEDGKYHLHIMEFNCSRSSLVMTYSSKVDLSSVNGGKEILGISSCKVKPYVYFYDNSNVYVYDIANKTFDVVYNSASRRISAMAVFSKIYYYAYNGGYPSFALGFESGEFEVFEFEKPNLKSVGHGGKAVFKATNNFGKIKQIIYKLGTADAFLSADNIY